MNVTNYFYKVNFNTN